MPPIKLSRKGRATNGEIYWRNVGGVNVLSVTTHSESLSNPVKAGNAPAAENVRYKLVLMSSPKFAHLSFNWQFSALLNVFIYGLPWTTSAQFLDFSIPSPLSNLPLLTSLTLSTFPNPLPLSVWMLLMVAPLPLLSLQHSKVCTLVLTPSQLRLRGFQWTPFVPQPNLLPGFQYGLEFETTGGSGGLVGLARRRRFLHFPAVANRQCVWTSWPSPLHSCTPFGAFFIRRCLSNLSVSLETKNVSCTPPVLSSHQLHQPRPHVHLFPKWAAGHNRATRGKTD